MNIAAQRFVFNLYRGQFMPVAEIARRHGKGRRAGHSGKTDIALATTLDAARDLNLASLATSEYQSLDLKKKDLAWQSVKGGGTQDETTRYTRLTAGHQRGQVLTCRHHLIVVIAMTHKRS